MYVSIVASWLKPSLPSFLYSCALSPHSIMPMSIEQSWSINASHLKATVTLKKEDVIEVNTAADDEEPRMEYFVHLSKSSKYSQRLILGCVPTSGQPGLENTNVLEQIRQLRDQARDALGEQLRESDRLNRALAHAAKMEGQIDVGIDAGFSPSSKKSKKEPKPFAYHGTLNRKCVSVDAPTMARPNLPGIPGVIMKVLIEPQLQKKNSLSVQIQLTEDNLLYLHEYATAQIQSNHVHHAHPRKVEDRPKLGVHGLSRIYRGRYAGKYRFRPKGGKSQIITARDDAEAMRAIAEISGDGSAIADNIDTDDEVMTDDGE